MAEFSLRKIVKPIAITALVIVAVLKLFFIDRARIPQNGMYPGLPAGSGLIVLKAKRAYPGPSSVKRGDIIVFVREENGQPYNYIWRVVGLPGEKVETSGQSLIINGETVKREKVREADGKTVFREQIGDASYEVAYSKSGSVELEDVSVTIPAGEFFVLGDNRDDALDSRTLGLVPFSAIIGRKL